MQGFWVTCIYQTHLIYLQEKTKYRFLQSTAFFSKNERFIKFRKKCLSGKKCLSTTAPMG